MVVNTYFRHFTRQDFDEKFNLKQTQLQSWFFQGRIENITLLTKGGGDYMNHNIFLWFIRIYSLIAFSLQISWIVRISRPFPLSSYKIKKNYCSTRLPFTSRSIMAQQGIWLYINMVLCYIIANQKFDIRYLPIMSSIFISMTNVFFKLPTDYQILIHLFCIYISKQNGYVFQWFGL